MFNLDKEQLEKLSKWQRECINQKRDTSASGGRFTYSFTPTGLGLVVKVTDYVTKKEIDLTDYDLW